MPKILTNADFDLPSDSADTPIKDEIVKTEDKKLIGGGPEDINKGDEKEPPKKETEPKDKGKKKETPAGDTPPKFKYASQEEAEKATKESEKRMHRATEEAAMLRKLLLDQNVKRSDTRTEEEEDRILDHVLAEIGKIDPEDKDYQKKCSRIWFRASREAAKLEVSQQAAERDNRVAADRDLEQKVDDALEESGFTSEWDKKAFAVMANYVPRSISDQDDQIEWVIGQIAEYRKTIIGESQKKADEEVGERRNLKVLGQGSNKKGMISSEVQEEYKPKTLGEQLRELKQKRRLPSKD